MGDIPRTNQGPDEVKVLGKSLEHSYDPENIGSIDGAEGCAKVP